MTNLQLQTKKNLLTSLAWRVGLVAVCVSVMVGLLTYNTTRREYLQTIDSLAHQAVARFNAFILPVLEEDAEIPRIVLQGQLERYTRAKIVYREGRTDVVALYGLDGVKLAEVRSPEAPVAARLPEQAADISTAERHDLELHQIDGKPYLVIVRSLHNSNGEERLKAGALFAISEATVTDLRQRLLRNLLLTVGIVLLTAALIYPLALALLRRVQGLSKDLMIANLETIQVLGSAIAKRDSDTDIHNYRVTLYSLRLAERVGLGKEDLQELIKGAFLHDVGKIGIHDEILLKPGKLDDVEFAEMKRHVEYGLDIVGRSRWLEDAARVVGNHHEKWDGRGYLQGLTGEEIPISARIFAIADVFDALTARRPYKEPFSLDMTLTALHDSRGSHFDPQLLDLFTAMAPELYQRYASEEKKVMQNELRQLIMSYFSTS